MERQLVNSAASKALAPLPDQRPLLSPYSRFDGRGLIGFYYLIGFQLVHLMFGRYGPFYGYGSISRLSDIDAFHNSRFQSQQFAAPVQSIATLFNPFLLT